MGLDIHRHSGCNRHHEDDNIFLGSGNPEVNLHLNRWVGVGPIFVIN